ncbi:MAG: ABC transporter ATP-binding protein [Alphaproteobacteria bacterium]|nr:ABC transporter ATP-binding protein [Alphaproteobacteria bacterium]
MMDNVAQITNLCKTFKSPAITAIDGLTLSLPKGEVIGLVGPDGAGKTTLIRLLLGLLVPSSGKISVLGLNPATHTHELHQKIGYMPQKFGLYEDLSVKENMNLYAELKGLTEQEKNEQFEWLLKFTGLKPFTSRLAGNLSGGMKQKLGLGCTLLGKPEFLLLDEPGVGVDPISRRELMKMVYSLRDQGITVLWSTSYLDEAENFDSVLLLNEGKLIFNGLPSELTQKLLGRVFQSKNPLDNPRLYLRKIIKENTNLVDAVISGRFVRIVGAYNQLSQAVFADFIPTKPRFEDAVIDILGGAVAETSPIAEQINTDNVPEIVIKAEGLTKKYGTFVAANNISFEIKRGEIFGLLGPNGAGKSTTFKMLCGLIKPTEGNGYILNTDMIKNPTVARSHLGYMAQKFSLFATLSVEQNLNFFSGIYGLHGSKKEQRIKQMTEVFELTPYLKQAAGNLPLGFKQRLALACAVMHNPPILFLDEPTSGVDPLTRREFWNHINSMVEKGVTVMVTTHFMDEAEYCDRIALIYQGQAIKIGTPDELKNDGETMDDAFIRLIEEYNKRSGK